MKSTVLFVWFVALGSCLGAVDNIIPEDCQPITNRALPWMPGVPGGVPEYKFCNSVIDYGAKGDGVTDDYPAFANAIANCTNGGFVWIPAGRYRLNRQIKLRPPQQIELRGAGPDKTFLESYWNYTSDARSCIGVGRYTGSLSWGSAISITGGNTKGSTALTLASVSGLSPNTVIWIKQDYDAAEEITVSDTTWGVRAQMAVITNIVGNTVYIDRPLYQTYSLGLNASVQAPSPFTYRSGLRNFTLKHLGTTTSLNFFGIDFWCSRECWAVNLFVTNMPGPHISIKYCLRNEIRDSWLSMHKNPGSTLCYEVEVAEAAYDNLIQNNIVNLGNLQMTAQKGASGNVYAYNFSDWGAGNGFNTRSSSMEGLTFHGDFPHLNLAEGNVMQNFDADTTWGSSQRNTFFRNWGTLKNWNDANRTILSYPFDAAFYIRGNNPNNAVIGCVASRFDTPTATTGFRYTSTTFDHGNFDFITGRTNWTTGVSRTLPNSYYLSSKPAWFGNLPWPPIGPDIAKTTSNSITNGYVIPAQARFFGYNYGVALNPPIPVTGASITDTNAN